MSRHDPLVSVHVIDFDILWTILNQDLPRLIETLEAIVTEGR
jgi:uncharacterized protein with HEPN domain